MQHVMLKDERYLSRGIFQSSHNVQRLQSVRYMYVRAYTEASPRHTHTEEQDSETERERVVHKEGWGDSRLVLPLSMWHTTPLSTLGVDLAAGVTSHLAQAHTSLYDPPGIYQSRHDIIMTSSYIREAITSHMYPHSSIACLGKQDKV